MVLPNMPVPQGSDVIQVQVEVSATLSPDTKIYTDDDIINISTIAIANKPLTTAGCSDDGTIVNTNIIVPPQPIMSTEVCKVRFSTGMILECGPFTQILTSHGWVHAMKLTPGTEIRGAKYLPSTQSLIQFTSTVIESQKTTEIIEKKFNIFITETGTLLLPHVPLSGKEVTFITIHQ